MQMHDIGKKLSLANITSVHNAWHKPFRIEGPLLEYQSYTSLCGLSMVRNELCLARRSPVKAGIILGDSFSQLVAQLNLFDENASRGNSKARMSLRDKLKQQGRGTLYFAGQGIQQPYQMKRDLLSPCYTTRLLDVPIAWAN